MDEKIVKINNVSVIEWLVNNYKNVNSGANQGLKYIMIIKKIALDDLKGKFTKEELTFLIDTYNGHLTSDIDSNPQTMAIEIEDADRYNNYGEKWGVDAKKLAEKAAGLSRYQVIMLLEWIETFWSLSSKDRDFEKYAMSIAATKKI